MKRTPSADLQGFSYGFLGVLGFSLTLPVTRTGWVPSRPNSWAPGAPCSP
ncbi:hypothetical protein HEP84_57110 [Streptomyces sp. RLB1-33]